MNETTGLSPEQVSNTADSNTVDSEQRFQETVNGLIEGFDTATERNVQLREVTLNKGTELNAAKKDINPK
ncbi:MAG: hypothetical protein AAF366_04060 [Pseudomonadota bacterium]